MSSEFNARLHRRWVQLLIDSNRKDIAALVIDGSLEITHTAYDIIIIIVDLPIMAFNIVNDNESLREVATQILTDLSRHYTTSEDTRGLEVGYRPMLLDIDEDWKTIAKNLIQNSKPTNQATVTDIVFLRNNKEPYLYNEMKFASQSEIRIAQELEKRKVLFFPLPLAVRQETAKLYLDHREVDFLICVEGTWGIMEVSYHPNRFEQDAEKDTWFKKSGILCIQHYTAERCYNESSIVVEEFLDILAKHRRF